MLVHAKKALEELKAINAPVFVHNGSRYHFVISGECNFERKYVYTLWADYYVMTDGNDSVMLDDSVTLDDFGVNKQVQAILEKHGLYCEWADPGTLCVYDA